LMPIPNPQLQNKTFNPKELFAFIDDGCVEISFYGNNGSDNQEKVDGKELMKKYILDAFTSPPLSAESVDQAPYDLLHI
jgi:hypothetical protein